MEGVVKVRARTHQSMRGCIIHILMCVGSAHGLAGWAREWHGAWADGSRWVDRSLDRPHIDASDTRPRPQPKHNINVCLHGLVCGLDASMGWCVGLMGRWVVPMRSVGRSISRLAQT